jgi:hypothetical protein
MDNWGVDASHVAVELARELARRSGVGDRCRFDVFDLDKGLPQGPPVDFSSATSSLTVVWTTQLWNGWPRGEPWWLCR